MSRKKLQLPKSRPIARVRGGKRLEVDLSMVPPTTGESIRVAFRADTVTLADIEEHLRRLEARAPGIAITLTDAVRSLIQRGAGAFREDARNRVEDK
jgi:hypothetical protein